MRETWAENIREVMLEYRAKKNISQKELARLAQVSERTINSVENGAQRPTARTRMKILLAIAETEGTK